VRGLSGAELRALGSARLDAGAWQQIFTVTVRENGALPVAGRYVVTDAAVEFHPHVSFDRTQTYIARFEPTRLPTPRAEPPAIVTIAFEHAQPAASTAVTAIYPSGDVWPENMLRFYIHFSAPMSRGHRTDFVHLVDKHGNEIPDAILATYSDLWNPDATRLTVFFDPGRVKRGVGPNVAIGRAIVEGRRYAIVVDAAWPDATGRPLSSAFRREFTAGAPAYRALDANDWRITAPRAGTRDAVSVVFPRPLDHALLERGLAVRTNDDVAIAGRASIDAAETRWSFMPDAPWPAGTHQLVAIREIEDPAGNRVGRAFEVLDTGATPTPAPPATDDVIRRTFTVQ
jgi:hypothetical protein